MIIFEHAPNGGGLDIIGSLSLNGADTLWSNTLPESDHRGRDKEESTIVESGTLATLGPRAGICPDAGAITCLDVSAEYDGPCRKEHLCDVVLYSRRLPTSTLLETESCAEVTHPYGDVVNSHSTQVIASSPSIRYHFIQTTDHFAS